MAVMSCEVTIHFSDSGIAATNQIQIFFSFFFREGNYVTGIVNRHLYLYLA